MSTVRIYELAKKLGITSKELIEELQKNGVEVRNHMSVVDEETAEIIMQTLVSNEQPAAAAPVSAAPVPAVPVSAAPEPAPVEQEVPSGPVEISADQDYTLQELAELLNLPPMQLQRELIKRGQMVALGHTLDANQVKLLATQFEFTVITPEKVKPLPKRKKEAKREEARGADIQPKPPVITVMGHVDHGKTSLLDAIRHSRVAEREAGGITQHIGASVVDLPQGKLVFLDTPGHEAFTRLRARGAQVTDMVILVVAADDGIMPQTVEAINHARAANVPIIVAINKIDKANAHTDRVKQELTKMGLVPEEWGGDVQMSEISAKARTGIDQLLEQVFLQAEILELHADVGVRARGIVIESRLDKGKGPLATVLIQAGQLRQGTTFVCGSACGRVRALLNDVGKPIKEAGPGLPVEVLGFADVPNAGDVIEEVSDEREARRIAQERKESSRIETLSRSSKITFEDLFSRIQQGSVKELNVVVKADVQGSAEAVSDALEKLSNEKVKVNVIHQGVGNISESDVMLASASNAIIVGFGVRSDAHSESCARREHVEIRLYRIIYEVLDDARNAMLGLLEPKIVETEIGRAEIRQVFDLSKSGTIAGCYLTQGKATRGCIVRVLRQGETVGEGTISSLKRFKDDVREVSSGYECGIMIDGITGYQAGDQLVFITKEKVAATMD